MRGKFAWRWGRRERLTERAAEEMEFHLAMQTEENVRRGMSAGEARRAAERALGNRTQVMEDVYRMQTMPVIEEAGRNFRFGLRTLRRSPGFALGAVSVLALAMGASVGIFSIVHTVLLQPLPYAAAERMVALETVFTTTGEKSAMVSIPDFRDWQQRATVFEETAIYFAGKDFAARVDGRAFFASPVYASRGFFRVFGQQAFAGRLFVEEEFQAEPGVAVVAHAWAEGQFGRAAEAVGKTIRLEASALKIVGVAKPGFRYPAEADLWLPSHFDERAQRNNYAYQAVGKMAHEATLEKARAELREVGAVLARENVENRMKSVTVTPLAEQVAGKFRDTLLALLAAVLVLWLIACANIANLQLGRAAERAREFALRAALGAGRGRLAGQLLTESLVLAGVAAVVGTGLAYWMVRGVAAWAPAEVPRMDEVRVDGMALLFAGALGLASTALFGLVPALQALRMAWPGVAGQGARGTASAVGARWRAGLVVAEVAMSVLLVVFASLMVRTWQALQDVELGFTTEGVLAIYTAYQTGEGQAENRDGFYATVLERIRALPGVSAAAGAAYLGMGWEPREMRDVFVDGRPAGRAGERPQAEFHAVTEDYLATLQIPLLSGRDFGRGDTAERPAVALINAALARVLFPGESPIGRRIRTVNPRNPAMEIIGVVGDTRWEDPGRPPVPMIYAATRQGAGNEPALLVRSTLEKGALVAAIREILRQENPAVPAKFAAMGEMVQSALRYRRFRAQVAGWFAGLSTLLAGVGVFSALMFLVGQRTKEVAVRRALGAQASDVTWLVLGHGLKLVGVGMGLGLGVALGLTPWLGRLVAEIEATDVRAYGSAVAILGGAAMVATLAPVLRAAWIDPAVALREE